MGRADTEKIRRMGHKQIKTYGVGKEKNKSWCRGIVKELLSQEAVLRDSEAYKALKITEKGRRVLFSKESFYILKREDKLPPPPSPEKDLYEASGKYDEDLFDALKNIRMGLANKKVFHPMLFSSIKPCGR